MTITTGTRVDYNGRTGTVREVYESYAAGPGAMIDWDEAGKRASNVLFTKLTVI